MANIQRLTETLQKNGFVVSYYDTAAQAKAALVSAIQGKTVGMGGSVTLQQMGLYEALSENNTVYWHWVTPGPDTLVAENAADMLICSVNGVAETGELINIDGTGNRLSGTTYGDKKVYLVFGVNKISPDFHTALHRVRNVVAPLNAKRLNRKTPCALSEEMKCYDCNSPDRICNGMTVLWRKLGGVREMEVVIIGEEIGY